MLGRWSFIGVLLLFFSCSKEAFFSKYQNIENNKWGLATPVKFSVNITDTLRPRAVFINIRNTNQYAYRNLFLVVTQSFNNTITQIDTLEYEMADVTGKWLGTGFTDVKENKLILKTNYVFSKKGTYTFSIVHAVRKNGHVYGDDYLEGISDVGLSIENQ
ncbi:MAG: gliding motility lipoprotein GldH [Flavobacteriaceae bacterium]|nr:gliding motility lipoprotein GldH [Flavobacteriaceae bacterium]